MNVFVVHSGCDRTEVLIRAAQLKQENQKLNLLILKNGNIFWKVDAAQKIQMAQMILFYVGKHSHESPYIAWELSYAMKHKKPIYTILLESGNKPHPVLTVYDHFSEQQENYDKQVSEQKLSEIIHTYEAGDYNLFNGTPESLDKNLLLEQYKAFLQTSEDLVLRRQNVNNFYISINSALIALFSALFAIDLPDHTRFLIGVLFALVGVVLSISWINILVAYGNLNGSKMKIISCIEKQLPASLYDAEWAALLDKLNMKRYVSFTDNEKNIPKIFIVVYFIILVLLMVSCFI